MSGLPLPIIFCRACGLPLNADLRKWNRQFAGQDGAHRVYCNDICRKRYEQAQRRHKQPPRHGVCAL